MGGASDSEAQSSTFQRFKLELAPLVNPSASKVGRAAPAQWYVRWNHYRNELVKQNLLNST